MACEECERRRKAIMAAAKRVAEWVRHPIGAPPTTLAPPPQLPEPEESKKGK